MRASEGTAVAILSALLLSAGVHARTASPDLELAGDEATCCAPESEVMDSRDLIQLTEWVRDRKLPIFSILVSRNGRLVYELYTSSLGRPEAHYQMSVTKSFVSALVGIAIEQGLISGPDAAVTDTLPRRLFRSDGDFARFRTVTLRHVLGMSALDAPDPPRSRTPDALARQKRFWAEPERVALALEQPLLTGHGHVFQYNDLNPMLATGVLQYATGKTALEFAEQTLFGPMDFRNYEWMHQDASGVDNGGYGLRLRPLDMQKFGILYLHDGVWRGKSLVPKSWVRQSFTPWIRTGSDVRRPNYGWFWWTYDGGRGWLGHLANGWKGQRIAVFPRQKVVLTVTACFDESQHGAFDQVVDFVARSLGTDGGTRAEAAQARLNALLKDVRTGYAVTCAGGERRMVPSVAAKEGRKPFKPAARSGQGSPREQLERD